MAAHIVGLVNVMTTTPMWVANTRLRLQGIKWKASKSSTQDPSAVSNTNYNGLIGEIYNL